MATHFLGGPRRCVERRVASRRGTRTVVGVLVTVATAAGSPGTADASSTPSVTGGGAGSLGGDRLQLQLSASGTGIDADGRFNVVHHTPGGLFARAAGTVDCLAVSGSSATVTGTVTRGSHSLGFDMVGVRVSIVVHDEEVDSFDMDLSFVSGHEIPPCAAEPIFSVVVDDGRFMVRP